MPCKMVKFYLKFEKKIDAALLETLVTVYQSRGPNIPEVLEPNN
jgi:hypothetical protein